MGNAIVTTSKLLFGLFLSFLVLAPAVISQSQNIDIKVNIIAREFDDAYVVGDTFYYDFVVNNSGDAFINDTFRVYLINPHGNILEGVREYNISLEPNEIASFLSKGGKEDETAAFPFDTAGDYHLIVNSTKKIDFYRRFPVQKAGYSYESYVRQSNSFNYIFDVMPRWQYSLWKQTSEANTKIIEANEEFKNINTELLNLTKDLNDATRTIKNATIAMLIVAFINLLILLVAERKTVSLLLKGFIRITLWICVIILAFLFIGFILNLLFNKA